MIYPISYAESIEALTYLDLRFGANSKLLLFIQREMLVFPPASHLHPINPKCKKLKMNLLKINT